MTGLLPFLSAIGAVGLLLLAIAAIRVFAKRLSWGAEVQRKCVHVMIGLFAMALPALFPGRWPVVALIVLALGAMFVLRLFPNFLGGAGAAIHSVERRSFGDIWLAVAVGFLFLRSDGHYILYGLPLAIITLSDSAAALTGTAYGRRRFGTEGGVKSWEGVVAFTMVGWVTAMSMLLLFSDAPRGDVIVLGLVIAAFGAMVEAVSWRGLDNLFVPLAVHFFLRGFLGADPWAICLVAAAFFAGAAIASAGAGRLRLARSTARAFAVALFIFLGVGGIYGAVIPSLAMVTYMLTRRTLPGGGRHPDLDFLGTLCAAAAIWLFIGEMVGPTSIDFYNLAMAGIALAYGMLALPAVRRAWWAAALIPLVWVGLIGFSLSRVHAAHDLWQFGAVAAIGLTLVAIAAVAAPQAFRRWRAPRVAGLSSAFPLIAYLYHVGTQ